MIYLDYAAATPLDPRVEKAMQPYWRQQFFNPSATYLASRKVAEAIKAARQSVAGNLGARPTEIIFTAGGTEADNLAIGGVMQKHPKAKVVVSAIEHAAVLQAAQSYPHDVAPVDKKGFINLAKLEQLIDDRTVLVSVMYANNEVGSIQPINQVAQLIQKIRSQRGQSGITLPLYLHTDASQAANYLDLHVSRLGVDLLTLNGGKMYGPKQTGILYVKAGVELNPIIRGGGQENNRRSGTENVPGLIGFTTALELAQTQRKDEIKRLTELQHQFEVELRKKIPSIVINSQGNRLPNIVHVTIPGIDNETVMMQLDEQGIMCAVGSACSASSEEPSHVLKAIGITEADAQSSLRFSFGRKTTQTELKQVVAKLRQLITPKKS